MSNVQAMLLVRELVKASNDKYYPDVLKSSAREREAVSALLAALIKDRDRPVTVNDVHAVFDYEKVV